MSFRIAIVGAGIGGLASALLLARDGHDLTLFERFAAPRPLGSGLVIQPVGLAVMDMIGAGEDLRRLSSPITRMLGHEAGGRKALGIPTVTGAEIASTPQDAAGRRLMLADGRDFGPYDLIVDASGAGSRLSPLKARPLGYGAIWGTVPWPETGLPMDQLRQRYRGASRMAGVLPIGRLPGDVQPLAAVFWSMPQAELDAWPTTPLESWRAEVATLWPDMAPFLGTIRDNAQMVVARYGHGTLRRPHAPGLVHIGDAAHRASPQLGQGANMALLDALALALALRGPKDQALADYAAMRRWHVRAYQGMSALFTPMYQSGSPRLPVLRDRLLAPFSTWPVVRGVLTHLVAGTMIPPLAGTDAP